MPRFDRLEFGSNSDGSPARQRKIDQDQDERSWLVKADAERRKGQFENALRYYSRALEHDRSLVTGWLGQVRMLVQLEEGPEADLWCRKALEVFPGNGELLAARAQALCRVGDRKQANALSDASMTAAGSSAFRWSVSGEVMLASGQSVDVHCFDKALQLDADWMVPLEASLAYSHHGVASRAHLRARQAVERGPDQFYAWYVSGYAAMQMDMNHQAERDFERCLELCPGYEPAKQRLVDMAHQKWSVARTVRRIFRSR